MAKKTIISVLILFLIFISVFIFKMIIIPTLTSETVRKTYTIDSIFTTKEAINDIIFQPKDDTIQLYINRGLEKYSLDYFRSRLLNKEASFIFTLRKSKICPINQITCDGIIIYDYSK